MYDLVLKNGQIVDGTRRPMYHADICIKDGLIAYIGTQNDSATEVLDVSRLVVSPGFIDIHSHSDAAPFADYIPESKLVQGVTTEICGNCGTSNIPATPDRLDELGRYFNDNVQSPLKGENPVRLSVSDYATDVNARGAVGNFGMLVGHGTLRLAVMGFVKCAPSDAEMEALKALLDRELKRGAFGMSLGLIYPPSAFSATEELVELAKVVKRHNAILSVHMRNEGPRIFEAVDEMLGIAEASGVRLHISHLKLMGRPQWGRSGELIKRIADARSRGIDVTCDQYPFMASSTSLSALMPHYSHEGGAPEMMKRLSAPEQRLKDGITQEMENRGGAETILVVNTYGMHPEFEGKYLSEVAEMMKLDPTDAAIKLLLLCETRISCVFFCINEQDVQSIMKQTFVAVGSDGYALSLDPEITRNNPHPRSFATFPRYLEIVRENSLLSLEDAVYKMTALPAQILGIADRGVIAESKVADLAVFDPIRVASPASYTEPKQSPTGIPHVIVGGKFALKDGSLTDARGGRSLLKVRGNVVLCGALPHAPLGWDFLGKVPPRPPSKTLVKDLLFWRTEALGAHTPKNRMRKAFEFVFLNSR